MNSRPTAALRADELRSMGRVAYWSQIGGRMLRAPLEAGCGMEGEVIGRTPWIPAEPWFGAMRSELGKGGLSNQKEIKAAIERAIKGEPLKLVEARTVDWILGEIERMRAGFETEETS